MTVQRRKREREKREALQGVIRRNIEYVLTHDFRAWLAGQPAAVQKRWGYEVSNERDR